MARSMWTGIISFGLVSIPVKLYKATESKAGGIAFHQLHDKCGTRIQEKRWCPECDQEVDWENVVKGYEYAKNEYVRLTDDDFAKLPLPSKKVVNINSFVEISEVDPIYHDKTYFLEPEKVAAKSYTLLYQALKRQSMVAIGTITLRNKERLCMLRPFNEVILVDTLLFPDELRLDDMKGTTGATPPAAELEMANKLIELMVDKFQPDKYKDHYKEALEQMVESKLDGEEIKITRAPAAGKVADLMEALEASLKNVKKQGTAARQESQKKETAEDKRTAGRKRAPAGKTKSSKSATHKTRKRKAS